jgi:hypothetical protein
MVLRLTLLLPVLALLAACAGFPAKRPVINSGSYDWTDQLRDAQGFPLPGWETALYPDGGGTGM